MKKFFLGWFITKLMQKHADNSSVVDGNWPSLYQPQVTNRICRSSLQKQREIMQAIMRRKGAMVYTNPCR